MRTKSRLLSAMALLIPLAAVGCESSPLAPQPVAAELTDKQAAVLANGYLRQNNIPAGWIAGEERVPNAWWFYYQTAFEPSVRPPSSSYLVQVRDDGGVQHLQ
jgi:hypothetical protein